MTCYWDSIRDSLTLNDYNILGFNQKPNMEQFINTIKSKNILVQNVLWQGNEFRNQEIVEHFEAIKNYNISEIKNGHLTSVCDSFLLLLCELLEVDCDQVLQCLSKFEDLPSRYVYFSLTSYLYFVGF